MALDLTKIPADVLADIRKRGYSDEEIARFSLSEAFGEFCAWHGLVNWGDTLLRVADALKAAEPVTYTEDASPAFNGMVKVTMRRVQYRGFTIKPKLDMGDTPHLSHANLYRTGWVVVDRDGCNAMPGASHSPSILAARASIDLWIESGFNGDKFWELMEPYRH